MTTTIGLADEIDQGIEEIDILKESDLRIDDDVEVESETTVIGETILMMTGHEDAARTLLTLGPVAEVKTIVASLQANRKVLNRARLVRTVLTLRYIGLKYSHRHLSLSLLGRRLKLTRWRSA
jgi:hypothetical protein